MERQNMKSQMMECREMKREENKKHFFFGFSTDQDEGEQDRVQDENQPHERQPALIRLCGREGRKAMPLENEWMDG